MSATVIDSELSRENYRLKLVLGDREEECSRLEEENKSLKSTLEHHGIYYTDKLATFLKVCGGQSPDTTEGRISSLERMVEHLLVMVEDQRMELARYKQDEDIKRLDRLYEINN